MSPLSVAAQDYLKAILRLASLGAPITTGAVASELGVASPSATAMLHRLERDQLLTRSGAREVQLTRAGEQEALRIVRRHRLVETFLVEVVGMSWDEVHVEAELLEHSVSDRLENRIDALLGHPTRDPHGDPIPPRHGPHREHWGVPLSTATAQDRFLVQRVSDRDPDVLQYLATLNVRPGVALLVEKVDPFDGPTWVRLDGGERHPLGGVLTHLIFGHINTDDHRDGEGTRA